MRTQPGFSAKRNEVLTEFDSLDDSDDGYPRDRFISIESNGSAPSSFYSSSVPVVAHSLFTQKNSSDQPSLIDILDQNKTLFDEVLSFLNQEEFYDNGEFDVHWGDGYLFAPSFDLAYYQETSDLRYLKRAQESLEVNRKIVLEAAEHPLASLERTETVFMAAMGLAHASQYATDNVPYQNALDHFFRAFGPLFLLEGPYIDSKPGDFAASSYGSTAMSAFMALLHLEYAKSFPQDKKSEKHVRQAIRILERIEKVAWNPDLNLYSFARHENRDLLYPNATMILVLARAFEATGDQMLLMRLRQVYEGIQPLKDRDGDHYHSPYSARSMGAIDPDYATQSSQNYLMMGLLLGYRYTEDPRMLEDVEKILGFFREKLLVDGRIVHHWINNRPASTEDPYLFCLGCNFQTLYILMMLKQELNAQ